jgi:hypothetical protein
MISRQVGRLDALQASRYFLVNTLVNLCAGVAVTAPVLVARLALPLKLTEWPGTWMFIGYAIFIGFGVLGTLAWSAIYYLSSKLLGVSGLHRRAVFTHLVMHNLSAYGVGLLMGYSVGYIGGSARLEGYGVAVITALVSWAVIPIGLLVFIGLLSSILGVAIIIDGWGKTRR